MDSSNRLTGFLSTKLPKISFWIGLAAILLSLIGYFKDSHHYFYSYLTAFMFFTGISLSALFLVSGLFVGFSAIFKFIKNKTTVNPVKIENASTLVNSGIFKYTRNPMYLGMLFILISISLNFNLYGGFIVVLLFYFFINKFQIKPEEKVMEEIFGDEYIEYKKTTRRWL